MARTINYSRKLKNKRFRKSKISGRSFNEELESDRGRSINSASVRRLQQKTQVFPLETNSAVRSRLTHSFEVMQVGRFIIKSILNNFKASNSEPYGLANKEEGIVSSVEIACLLHDIGNPPFGHFGEAAICDWANSEAAIDSIFNQFPPEQQSDLIPKLKKDLKNFEGNAQAIRSLHSLQCLNLTYTQIASLIKYTRPAYEDKPINNDPFINLKKKPGFYYSEEYLIQDIRRILNIKEYHRFPLAYIMEAADDISYCIADIEDAVEKGIIDIDKLESELKIIWKKLISENNLQEEKKFLPSLLRKARNQYKALEIRSPHDYILNLRTNVVTNLVNYASKRYLENHQKIFNGSFNEALLDGNTKYQLLTRTLKEIAKKHVFSFPDVENLELKGYAIIKGLLEIYTLLIHLSSDDFKKLIEKDFIKEKPYETRLFHKLPSRYKLAYKKAVDDVNLKTSCSDSDKKALELYYRTRLILDYISGMTDQFALDEYRNLAASI